jgi:transposase
MRVFPARTREFFPMGETQDRRGGRPTKYRPEYCRRVVEFCRQGYSLTAFAAHIDVSRSRINQWMEAHKEFREAVSRAKHHRTLWWEERARKVAEQGGPGGQATLLMFMLKNHAPDEYSDSQVHRHVGFDGAAVRVERVERIIISAPEEVEPVIVEGEVIDHEPSAYAVTKRIGDGSER